MSTAEMTIERLEIVGHQHNLRRGDVALAHLDDFAVDRHVDPLGQLVEELA
jgi:hypothetical protein